MTNIITESHDSPPYFQHLLVPTSYPICKTMLINQVLVDSVLRTNYLTLLLTSPNSLQALYPTQTPSGAREALWLEVGLMASASSQSLPDVPGS